MSDRSAVAERLVRLFRAVEKDWEAGAENDLVQQGGLAYVRFMEFTSTAKVEGLLDYYGALLACVDRREESVGCDLGCWLGFATAVQAALGCRRVYGVDIRGDGVREAEAWRRRHGVDAVRFRPMKDGTVPLLSGTLDWVIVNHVLCNAPLGSFRRSLSEAHRILRPGGTLILADGNNPYCERTEQRLKREFWAAEIGEGTAEAPAGLNHTARRHMIAMALPELSQTEVERLALETCYLWGVEVLGAARRYSESGEWPGSRFEAESLRTPLLPSDGAANGNITDPFRLCAQMEALGFGAFDITGGEARRRLDDDELWELLGSSMNFAIYADKLR